MKSKLHFVLILLWFVPGLVQAQSDAIIEYHYDANGNRIEKTIVYNTQKNAESDSTENPGEEYVFKFGEEESKEKEEPIVIKAYPNPTQGKIHLKINLNKTVDYVLYEANGRKIKSGRIIKQGNLNIYEEKPGMYLLRIKAGDKQKTIKVLKH